MQVGLKNKQYKSCNEKDAEKLLAKIKTQEIPLDNF